MLVNVDAVYTVIRWPNQNPRPVDRSVQHPSDGVSIDDRVINSQLADGDELDALSERGPADELRVAGADDKFGCELD